jgi:hypothetical protein
MDMSWMKLLLQPAKDGLSFLKIQPFLCFQMFQQAIITTSMKNGFLKATLVADKEP